MSRLEELDHIKQLKYKYLRCIDCKLWQELREVFAEDVDAAYDKGRYSASGVDAVMEFLTGALRRTDVASMHQVHCPEIELTSPTTAKATWYLHDYVVNPGEDNGAMPGRSILQGAGFYSDEYVKIDGRWKIQHTGYERTFEYIRPYVEEPGVTLRTRWNP
ncbi:MAG: nuclear transport factor 2 family protein [Myxococcota bacterium]|nr:nuclear transport factor 2 family protein [Myxococcota bacterium]